MYPSPRLKRMGTSLLIACFSESAREYHPTSFSRNKLNPGRNRRRRVSRIFLFGRHLLLDC
jgi:hypothetical protein